MLLEKTEQLGGMDPSVFGMHSLWAGGTTAAVRAGVVHHLFKRYGRWRSEPAMDGYVKDALVSSWGYNSQLVSPFFVCLLDLAY